MASRCHILVVEDEPSVLEVLQATLEESYRVSSVGTVGEACAFLRTSHVDLVLVDWGSLMVMAMSLWHTLRHATLPQ
jgi:DNA-binding response OmpR family regulator